MTKRNWIVIVCVLSLTILLSGCKLPASKAPATPTGQDAIVTPIPIKTDSSLSKTQTAIAESKEPPTATLAEDETLEPTQTHTVEPTEPTEPVVVPTITRPAEYTVQEGEFLYCLARRFDLNPQDLLDLNNLGENELVEPGTTLQIPQEGSWPGDRSLNPHPTTHSVRAGETIYSIACHYGDVSPEAIIAVNKLEEPYELKVGQQLNIP